MHFKDSNRMNAYFLCRPVSLSMNLTFNAPTLLCQKVLLFIPRPAVKPPVRPTYPMSEPQSHHRQLFF